MTISNTANSVTVQGDGLTTLFNYTFPMGGSSNYAVLVYTDANGVETTVAVGDFTITGVTSQTGGTFTYPLVGSPIATGTSLTLSRVLPLVQNAAIGDQGNFYPSVVEGALDYQMMVAQQLSAVSGTLDALSLFGNSSSAASQGGSIPIGSGLSFSGNTLVVSGISGSGTVTQVDTGTGLTGGPITGVGTVSMSTISTGFMLANFSGATAAPQAVSLSAGAGITFSSTTTSVTVSAYGMAFITSSTPTATTTVVLSAIPQTYTHLLLLVSGRSTGGASPGVSVNMTFNGDSATNYDQHFMQLQQSTVGPGNTASNSLIQFGFLPWSSSTALNAGYGRAEIFNYTDNGLHKVCDVGRGAVGSTSIDASWIFQTGYAQWRSTASITTITLALATGNWATGSKVSLYGLT